MKKAQHDAVAAWLWLSLALAIFSSCRVGGDQVSQASPFLFVDVTEESRLVSRFGSDFYAWADISQDSFPDLFATRHRVAPLLSLNRDGKAFQDVFSETGMKHDLREPPETSLYLDKHGCAWGDYDNDGKLELYIANGAKQGKGFEYNQLYKTEGPPWRDMAETAGVRDPYGRGRNAAWADINNDGALDLYVQNDRKNAFYQNKGMLRFQNIRRLVSKKDTWLRAQGDRVSSVDYDNDGDQDLFIAQGYSPDQAPERFYNALSLFRNESHLNNWLKIRLIGTQTNREGIGAKIFLRARGGVQFREANHGPSGYAQDALPVHFGLGSASRADEIEIRWPSGIRQIVEDVPARQTWIIREPPVGTSNPEQREGRTGS